MLTYRLNYLFGGYKPIGYHLINVLLHCLATGLVVKVAHLLLPPVWGPAISGALFATHPIHTEAVAGLVGRADLAACNLYLLALLTYSKHVTWRTTNELKSWAALFATIVLSAAAVLCKETAVTALLLCAIYDAIKGINGYHDKVNNMLHICMIFVCTVRQRVQWYSALHCRIDTRQTYHSSNTDIIATTRVPHHFKPSLTFDIVCVYVCDVCRTTALSATFYCYIGV